MTTKERIKGSKFYIILKDRSLYEGVRDYLRGFPSFKYLISVMSGGLPFIFVRYAQSVTLLNKNLKDSHTQICRGKIDDNIQDIKKSGVIMEEIGHPHCRLHTVGELMKIKDPSCLLSMELSVWELAKTMDQRCKLADIKIE